MTATTNQDLANTVADVRRIGWIGDNAIVDASACIGNTAEWIGRDTRYAVYLGDRTIIRPLVTIDRGVDRPTIIGNGCLLMAHVHIGHDVQIGDGVQIAPGAVIGGCVTIGNDVKIGMNASIVPHRTIGTHARVGAGAVVTHDIPDNEVWVGNPARRLLPLDHDLPFE